MGKNFFKGIIVLACFLLCTLAFCGCSVLGEIHIVHDFGEWETVIEPTCTESGKQESKCSGCYFIMFFNFGQGKKTTKKAPESAFSLSFITTVIS